MADPRYDARYQRGYVAPAAPPPTRNPWLVPLFVVAAVLVPGGCAAFVGARMSLLNPTPVDVLADHVLPLLVLATSPWTVAAGAAAFLGAVLVRAARP